MSLSAISGTPIRVSAIRGGRPKPGLQAQHLAGVEAVASCCPGSSLRGAALQSQLIEFDPSPLAPPPNLTIDTKTAGAVTLLAQVLLPCLASSREPLSFTLRGGTDVPFSPPADHVSHALLPFVNRIFGLRIAFVCGRRGFYPAGGGEARFSTDPLPDVPPFERGFSLLESGHIADVLVRTYGDASGDAAVRTFVDLAVKCDVLRRSRAELREIVRVEASGGGFGGGAKNAAGALVVVTTSTGGVLCGDTRREARGPESRLTAEELGAGAARAAVERFERGAPVDEQMGDQLLALMAICPHPCALRIPEITDHVQSAVAAVSQILPASNLRITPDPPGFIVRSDGYRAPAHPPAPPPPPPPPPAPPAAGEQVSADAAQQTAEQPAQGDAPAPAARAVGAPAEAGGGGRGGKKKGGGKRRA